MQLFRFQRDLVRAVTVIVIALTKNIFRFFTVLFYGLEKTKVQTAF